MSADAPGAHNRPAWLKADLHLHTCESDKEPEIRYDACGLIDEAHRRGYDVLSITNHDTVTCTAYLRDYAAERGIVLIPGVELTVQGTHVLAYNLKTAPEKISSFRDLQRCRTDASLIIAPHPFFPSRHSLGSRCIQHAGLFDAIELCHFYTTAVDFNRRARKLARGLGLPLIGTSDSHTLSQFGTTYSLIQAPKDAAEIIRAVKKGSVRVVSAPLSAVKICKIALELFLVLQARCTAARAAQALSCLLRRPAADKEGAA